VNEVEKKIEVERIDPLYFVVRDLDSPKVTTKDKFNKVYKEFDKIYKRFEMVDDRFNKIEERFNRVDDRLHDLKVFTVRLVFAMAGLIIAGVVNYFGS
jgi:hypothetical protein